MTSAYIYATVRYISRLPIILMPFTMSTFGTRSHARCPTAGALSFGVPRNIEFVNLMAYVSQVGHLVCGLVHTPPPPCPIDLIFHHIPTDMGLVPL